MRDLGDKLNNATECYNQGVSKLTNGNGDLITQVESLKRLGAKAQKSIPANPLNPVEGKVLPPLARVAAPPRFDPNTTESEPVLPS
jgi:DNA anti-recombination protein RmuC